jgi:ferric-dicitrate binding protein FerR (iron transport regulator)
MKLCELRTGYLDRTLDREELRVFESHLGNCKSCREKTSEWRNFEGALKALDKNRPIPTVTSEDAARLMMQADSAPSSLFRPLALALALTPLAAAACLLAIGLWVNEMVSSPDETPTPTARVEIASGGDLEIVDARQLPRPIAAADDTPLVARIDSDRVGLAPGGRMSLLKASGPDVRVRLDQGTAAYSVSSRRHGGHFVVVAGVYTVRVLGTRFQVTRDSANSIEVLVERGTVEVTGPKGVFWILRQGDIITVGDSGEVTAARAGPTAIARLHSLLETAPLVSRSSVAAVDAEPAVASSPVSPPRTGAVPGSPAPSPTARDSAPTSETPARETTPRGPKPEAPATPSKKANPVPAKTADDLATWRQWILAGRTIDARVAMRRYLEHRPRDAGAWTLLADCERKERNWYSAVSAYEKVIAHGSAKQASHARYMSATIYQDRLNDHERAVKLLREYRRTGVVQGELRDLTDVKMARSLIALGNCAEATRVLNAVITNQGNSFVAANAKKLLKKCEPSR